MTYTDKQLLDFLEAKNKEAVYTGKCLWRMSSFGRGWRLYETSQAGAKREKGAMNEVRKNHQQK